MGAFWACRWSRGAWRAAFWSCDRADARKFEGRRGRAGESAAAQVMRIVQSERVFQAVERSKHEHERFYQASAALNRALTLDEVYDAAIAGARGVCEFDFAAIATYEPREAATPSAAWWAKGRRSCSGPTHRDPSSLASMVVKNKLALPAGGDWRDRDVPVFSHPMRMQGLRIAARAAADRQGRGDRHLHGGRAPRRALSPATGARCWGDRQPGGDLDAERAACTRCWRSRPPPTG